VTANNGYTGGTEISAGILQLGNGGTSGGLTGDVAIDNGAALVINRSDELTLDGTLSGQGGVRQQGSGTTILAGTNSYAGGTSITGGVLQVSSDANLGDAAGAIDIDQGTLRFTSSFDSARDVAIGTNNAAIDTQGNTNTLSGVLSGPGGLIKDGTGTLVLTGDNSYAGGSQVNAGILQIGNGGTSGSLQGPVNLAGAGTGLVIDLASDLTLDGVISGQGDLVQQGAGVTTLTAANTYTGTTAITDGELRLAGAGTIEQSDHVILDGILDVTAADASDVSLKSIEASEGSILRAGDKHVDITDARGDVFAGIIEGDGASVELSAGSMRLTGENTYTGGTSVDTGAVLTVGDGGEKGSIAGAVQVDGTLIYDRSDRYTVNQLNGNGTLTVTGGGEAVINTEQNLTGKIKIENGDMLALEGQGDVSRASGVEIDGRLDVSGSEKSDIHVHNISGEDTGRVLLGDRNVVITDGNGSDFAGIISGSGGFTVEQGKQILSGDNSYSGDTLIAQNGWLQLGTDDHAGVISASNVTVDGLLSGSGTMKDLNNRGTVSPGTDDSFGTLVVGGNYLSENGSLIFNVALDDDNSKGDRLVVAGNTAGTTDVSVINRGGLGAQTAGGILLIGVGGQSDGVFNLNGDYVNYRGAQAVVAGAYAYTLEKGTTGVATDGNWYLRSELKDKQAEPEYQAGVPLYQSWNRALSMRNRTGFASINNRYAASNATSDTPTGDRGNLFWGRIQGGYSHYNPQGGTVSTTSGVHDLTLQTGLDGLLMDNDNGTLYASGWFDYIKDRVDVWSKIGDGRIDVDGYGLGGALTFYAGNGFYLDGQAKATWYRSDFESRLLSQTLATDAKSFGYALSLEAGHRVTLNERWSVTPQTQLIWSSVSSKHFRDSFDASVDAGDASSLTARIGAQLDYQTRWTESDGTASAFALGGIANIYQELSRDGDTLTVSGTALDNGTLDRTWGELGVVTSYSWLNGRYMLTGKVTGATGLNNGPGNNTAWSGNTALHVKW